MKTGSFLVRLLAGVPVVAGLCLMQGCSTTSSKTTETPPAFSNVPPETVATPTPVVSSNKVEVAPVVEKAVLKPVPPMTTPYTVKAGETATEIAAKYGKRWQDVLAVNPELKKDTKLRAGQTIQLPNPVDLAHPKAVVHKAKKVEKKPAAPTEAKPEAAAAAPAAGEASYTVKKGDTIATIAAKHHVKRSALEKANNLTAKSQLKVGAKLVIPAKAETAAPAEATPAAAAPGVAPAAPDAGTIPPPPVEAAPAAAPAATPAPGVVAAPAAAPAAATKTYTVKEGEDVYAVAIRWGVSPAELKALNNLTSSDLQAGQVLKIPAVATPAP
jgi:LysM repeat protein